jgi:hypothetical protein
MAVTLGAAHAAFMPADRDQADEPDRPATRAEIDEITGESGGIPSVQEFLLILTLLGAVLAVQLLR